MTTPIQVALPLVVLTLVAGSSLIVWVVLFRRAAKTEASDPHHPDPSHSGAH